MIQFTDEDFDQIFPWRKKGKASDAPPDPNQPDLQIFHGRMPKVHPTEAILESLQGRGWHSATLTEAERDAEAKRLQEEATGMVEIPRPEW